MEADNILLKVILTFLLTILLPLCLWKLFKFVKFVRKVNEIAGPRLIPLYLSLKQVGTMKPSNISTPSTLTFEIRQGTCRVYCKEKMVLLWLGTTPVVMLFGPKTVEPLLSSNVSINKSKLYRFIEPWLGKGLVTSQGREWRSRRKLLTPTFHFRILQDFLPIMNHHAEVLVEKIRSHSKEPWIDIVPLLTYCTLDIISETAMGVRGNYQENHDSEYCTAVHEMTRLLSLRAPRPWLWSDLIYHLTSDGLRFKKNIGIIQNTTAQVIREKKGQNDPGNNNSDNDLSTPRKKLAFLDLLLEEHYRNPDFTEKDMTDEVNTFMFGGHDTTSTSLTWVLYLLGLYGDIQDKVYNELVEVTGGETTTNNINLDNMKDTKYMDKVIKECQRLYPPIPGFARKLEEDLTIGDKVLPNGTEVYVFIYMLHRDPDIYPNPETFDPERFSMENETSKHPFAFIPFSAGPRNCIGQKFANIELKVLLSQVLLNFKLVSLDPRDKVVLAPDLVLRCKDPVRIKFIPRRSLVNKDAF